MCRVLAHEMKGEVEGKDDESHIYGGDIRLFDVTVKNEKINVMRKINQVSPVTGSYLATDNMMYLKEVIRTMLLFLIILMEWLLMGGLFCKWMIRLWRAK